MHEFDYLRGAMRAAAPEAKCPHESGQRVQKYDADGGGYFEWVCDACGWTTLDDMP
jgi:hypothetical protein